MSPSTWETPRLPYNFIPGGSQHWEEKQSLDDRRKWKLAEINGHRYLTMMNGKWSDCRSGSGANCSGDTSTDYRKRNKRGLRNASDRDIGQVR